eukprot:CAMPEP_0113319712 /NCGR_PEP_ID=MMETSP0010_2-20120614/13806_1 /TAXON_ID=216773 ORGANISM="Corethron hystrix, Strain 308" /NCGR_SAMPLE_ID=MMETSP0010_2 /ASSEMBLY_ACC=CAM_ASM_000155 /LENGTH=1282 /DNA_ID=CAMNT_0000177339 /DNA_START=108 /DNA_END=3952 /DNA_ORIENTATION=+ /assembly_acc=CAM_ASM_000155
MITHRVRSSLNLFLLTLLSSACAIPSLTFSSLKSIINTEATNDVTAPLIDHFETGPTTTVAGFSAAVSTQWVKNELEHESAPYAICDSSIGSGWDRRLRLEQVCNLDTTDNIIYNGDSEACFLQYLDFYTAKFCAENESIQVTPYTAWMKVPANTMSNSLGAAEPRYLASFCIEDLDSVEKAKLAAQISEGLENTWEDDTGCSRDDPFANYFNIKSKPEGIYMESTINFDSLDYSCSYALVGSLASHSFICGIEHAEIPKILNTNGRWIMQGALTDNNNNRVYPLYDAGIDGAGQVAQVSDTGVSVNSCYFFDPKGEVPRDRSGGMYALAGGVKKILFQSKEYDINHFTHSARQAVQSNLRKIVQYYGKYDEIDGDGHGTHCAGTVAGSLCTGDGCAINTKADGIAPGAKIAFYDIHHSDIDGLYPDKASVMFGLGIAAGAYIHSASWGSGGNRYSNLDRTWDEFMWDNRNYLGVMSAGNYGSFDQPASVVNVGKNSLIVGATNNYSKGLGQNYLADFSSRGPSGDGRIKPDICAPGASIFSAKNTLGRACQNEELSGTSMAAPGVAGAALLVRQYFMDGFYPSGTRVEENQFLPSQALIRAVIINSGKALAGVDGVRGITESVPYDIHQGFGRISLIDSLLLRGKSKVNIYVDDRMEMTNKSPPKKYYFLIDNCDAPYFSATLVWTDKENRSTSCASCIVNRLDLTGEVNGIITYPNGLTGPDVKNNVQRVRLKSTPGDVITVKISVANLAESTQPFSLVVSGCITTLDPANVPTVQPSYQFQPSDNPSDSPSKHPSLSPSNQPSNLPSFNPSSVPTFRPSIWPSDIPSDSPSKLPSSFPSYQPSTLPSKFPSSSPSYKPSNLPSFSPSNLPSTAPSPKPSNIPSSEPSSIPSNGPSEVPSQIPSKVFSMSPSGSPSKSKIPSEEPSDNPSKKPSRIPSSDPSKLPSMSPSDMPSMIPSKVPSNFPSQMPSKIPSSSPSKSMPPSDMSSKMPSKVPSNGPLEVPSKIPSSSPSRNPSLPSQAPSDSPSPPSITNRPSLALFELPTTLERNDDMWSTARGNMFNVLPKKNIRLTDMDIHRFYAVKKVLEIWVRKGSWEEARYDQSKWNLLGRQEIVGGGAGKYTSINDPGWLDFDMAAGEVYGLYLRFTNNSKGLITVASKGSQNSLYAQNEDIQIMTGVASKKHFADYESEPHNWQGKLKYHVFKCPTKEPSRTSIPTVKPSLVLFELPTTLERNDDTWSTARGNMFNILPKKNIRLIDMDIHRFYSVKKVLEIWVRKGSW